MFVNYQNTTTAQTVGFAASLAVGSASFFGTSTLQKRIDYLKECSSSKSAYQNIQNFSKALFGTTPLKMRASLAATSILLGTASYALTQINPKDIEAVNKKNLYPQKQTNLLDNNFCNTSTLDISLNLFSTNASSSPINSKDIDTRSKGNFVELTIIIGGVARKAMFEIIPPPTKGSKKLSAKFVNKGSDLKDLFPGISRISGTYKNSSHECAGLSMQQQNS